MAKKQSRRSVSLSRPTYERLRAYCEINDLAMSEFVEMRIGDFLGRAQQQQRASATVVPAGAAGAVSPASPMRPVRDDDAAKRIFTF
jgi:hypothetical protein